LYMLDLLKNIYNRIENIKGRKLVFTVIAIFVTFMLIGILIGYFNDSSLKGDELNPTESGNTEEVKEVSYEGTITFLGEGFYPEDKISYVLTDTKGEEIILLRATDDKLAIVENLNVQVIGKVSKTKDGRSEVLVVREVVLKNATN